MFKHYEIEQNTDDWLNMRAGKLTMSKLNVVMANFGKAFGEPAKKYAIDIAVEQITRKPVLSSYSNDSMNEGHIREPIAIARYEAETFTKVEPGGFFCDDKIGYSPDGRPGEGLLEVKNSITTAAHFERIKKQQVDSAYRWQVIGGLKYTGKPWLDFVSFCQDFPDDRQLFILRVYADQYEKEFQMIDERVEEFFKLVAETKATILNAKYF
jgi:hypothetical protein